MKLIQLSQNKYAKVDDELFDFLSQWKWHYDGKYARRNIRVDGKLIHIYMHRVIAQAKPGEFVDHINGDPFDNRAENLRLCNHSTNAMNMRKHRGRSIYKGVTKRGNSYRTVIWKDNEKVFDASCRNERWAGMIYDLNAPALFGEYARLNFSGATVAIALDVPVANLPSAR